MSDRVVYKRRAGMGDLVPGREFYHVCYPAQQITHVRIDSYPYWYKEGWSYRVDMTRLDGVGSLRQDSAFLSDIGIDSRHNGGNALFDTHDDAIIYAATND